MTFIVQMIRSFLWDLTGRWERTFQKYAFFTKTIVFGPFPRFIERDKPQGTIHTSPKAVLTVTVENLTAFFGPKRLLETQIFERKANFPVIKTLWPIFSRSIEHDNCQGTVHKVPQGNLAVLVDVIKSNL